MTKETVIARRGTARHTFASPSPSPSSREWETVFASPAKATLKSLATGSVLVRLSGLVDLGDEKASGLCDASLEVPVYAHLIRHEALGDFLVDAGLDRGYVRRKAGSVRGLASPFLPVPGFQDAGADAATSLESMGVVPACVFYTHLHFDHCAGALDLGPGIRHVVGPGEPEFGVPFLAIGRFFRHAESLEELDFSVAQDMPFLGPCLDLLGDGSLWAFRTPGHSIAHVSYLFNGSGGPALLAGDAVSLRASAERAIGPGAYSGDLVEGRRSAERIRGFIEAYPNVRLVCGHEL